MSSEMPINTSAVMFIFEAFNKIIPVLGGYSANKKPRIGEAGDWKLFITYKRMIPI
ncbi:hypothetical protein [Xenorhabdus littoralis]|uniref:hypothetical protein n=1 Tax=Xenorhabdus littoralis TaxID=2582835 RepID=UPI0029E7EB4A|nr:hypothetical protein [Xenorhabdus sp. Reich]